MACAAEASHLERPARLVGLGALLLWTVAGNAAGAERIAIEPLEAFSGAFAGRTLVLNVRVDAPQGFQGRLGFRLAVGSATVARRELTWPHDRRGRNPVGLNLPVPEVKPGLVIDGSLSVDLYEGATGLKAAGCQRRLWIFSPDAFASRSQWLKRLDLRLFDPQGATGAVLERSKIPFRRIHNVAALGSVTDGVLIVGEDTSWVEYRGLPQLMLHLAAAGVPVICLAPSEGSLPVPGARGSEAPRPGRLVLRREDAITELDKRLDARAWPPDGQTAACGLSLVAEGRRVIGRVESDSHHWPWMEVHYDDNGAMLLICGFALIERWDAGPTPRYLFLRMLEFVTGQP